jgi:hypothetical protein
MARYLQVLALLMAALAAGSAVSLAGECDGTKPRVRVDGFFPGPAIRLLWTYDGPSECSDGFNVRWGPIGGAGTQVEVDPPPCPTLQGPGFQRYCLHDFALPRNGSYMFKVQACNEREPQASHCSQWGEYCYGLEGHPELANMCQSGFVWREAFEGDYVCVTPDERARAQDDNNQAGSRIAMVAPNTCLSGFVWREAFDGDVVCVTPETRSQALADNQAAPSRWRPPSGPLDTPHGCIAGYVWRMAQPRDFVCVTRAVRDQVRRDNADAAVRRGTNQCRSGYVWREAKDGDLVCVTPETRQRVKLDNERAKTRYVCPRS